MHQPEISKKEQQNTVEKFTNEIEQMTNEPTILRGDYNLYMNPLLDKLDQSHEQQDSRNYSSDMSSYIEVNNMVDICRAINPDRTFFTWHRGSRLDYIFTSEHILDYVDECNILPGNHTDHSPLRLSLKIGNTSDNGRRFWKFSASLL